MASSETSLITVMVSSSVYKDKAFIHQVCGILAAYGYSVVNSEYGTLHPPLGSSNEEACLQAVKECDVFFGIIMPRYGSGLTHKEFNYAVSHNKPRWFIAEKDVVFARQLLRPLLYNFDADKREFRNTYTHPKTSVMDNCCGLIDMYRLAIQEELEYNDRRSNWVQEFRNPDEAFRHIETLFRDTNRVRQELTNYTYNQ